MVAIFSLQQSPINSKSDINNSRLGPHSKTALAINKAQKSSPIWLNQQGISSTSKMWRWVTKQGYLKHPHWLKGKCAKTVINPSASCFVQSPSLEPSKTERVHCSPMKARLHMAEVYARSQTARSIKTWERSTEIKKSSLKLG